MELYRLVFSDKNTARCAFANLIPKIAQASIRDTLVFNTSDYSNSLNFCKWLECQGFELDKSPVYKQHCYSGYIDYYIVTIYFDHIENDL